MISISFFIVSVVSVLFKRSERMEGRKLSFGRSSTMSLASQTVETMTKWILHHNEDPYSIGKVFHHSCIQQAYPTLNFL